MSALQEHLATGVTTVARCWSIERRDGVQFGFTDHDRALTFDGIPFRADAGLTARALVSATGLSVDNSEAMGALSDAAITETDIEAGRYDGATVKAWLVNWADVSQRSLRFAGSLGELRRAGGAFHAELRGLSEALNTPRGRVYQTPCAAVLGDRSCAFDLNSEGYAAEVPVQTVQDNRRFVLDGFPAFETGWFERGRLRVLTGAGAGLIGIIKRDRFVDGRRTIDVWQSFRAPLVAGDSVRIEAGCDKRAETCRLKFNNLINFQGFPDIPGDDWLISTPISSGDRDGGSLRRDAG